MYSVSFTLKRSAIISFCLLCSDIDECTVGNGGCQHNCDNTAGSYHCYCRAGYTLDGDSHSCNGKCCGVS